MFDFIRRKISRKISVLLLLCSIPIILACGWWVTAYETEQLEVALIEKGKVAAISGASAYSAMLTMAVQRGEIKLEDIVNPVYVEFQYHPQTNIKRYHSGIDAWTDHNGIQLLEDTILKSSPEYLYALGEDWKTYIPTTNGKFDHPPTGNVEVDFQQSRQKRKYEDKLHQKAVESLTVLVQPYYRDTGDPCWDIAAPITVMGAHFGSFRVGVMRDKIAYLQYLLIVRLMLAFMFLLTGLWMVNMILIHRTTRALEDLTIKAQGIARGGEDMKKNLKTTGIDEVAELTRSINGMRYSLSAAMERLGVL